MFEKAVRMKLRVATTKGNLSVEDLWDLSLAELNDVAKGLNKTVKELGEEDFLKTEDKSEREARFSFDLVIHILNTKKEEADAAVDRRKRNEVKHMLLAALEAKQADEIKGLTEEEIKQKIKELDS